MFDPLCLRGGNQSRHRRGPPGCLDPRGAAVSEPRLSSQLAGDRVHAVCMFLFPDEIEGLHPLEAVPKLGKHDLPVFLIIGVNMGAREANGDVDSIS